MSKSYKDSVNSRFIELVDIIMEKEGIKKDIKFCKRIDISSQTFSNIRSGLQGVRNEVVERLFRLFGANPTYILTGSGPKFVNDEATPVKPPVMVYAAGEDNFRAATADDPNVIRHVSIEAEAGFIESIESQEPVEEMMLYALPGVSGGYSFEVKGHSMFPTFRERDIIVAVPEADLANITDQYIYVIVTHSNVLIKRVVKRPETNELELISENEDKSLYPNLHIHLSQVKMLLKAKAKISWHLTSRW